MVTKPELNALEDALNRGHVPVDFAAKLDRLRKDDPRELYLRQQCLLLVRLLTSPAAQAFCCVDPGQYKRLLRVLAYVRKDEDAIPDTWPNGMADDHDLMRITCTDCQKVVDTFKAWHLLHQVPVLWQERRLQGRREWPTPEFAHV